VEGTWKWGGREGREGKMAQLTLFEGREEGEKNRQSFKGRGMFPLPFGEKLREKMVLYIRISIETV